MVARGCFFSVIKSQFQANKETRQARAVKSNVHIYFFPLQRCPIKLCFINAFLFREHSRYLNEAKELFIPSIECVFKSKLTAKVLNQGCKNKILFLSNSI